MSPHKLDQLESLYVDILAHYDNDWKITFEGNGVDPVDARATLRAVFNIIVPDWRQWEDEMKEKSLVRAKELRKQYWVIR